MGVVVVIGGAVVGRFSQTGYKNSDLHSYQLPIRPLASYFSAINIEFGIRSELLPPELLPSELPPIQTKNQGLLFTKSPSLNRPESESY